MPAAMRRDCSRWRSGTRRQIVQARQKFNKLPSPKELMILRRWTNAGGPTLSGWMAR